jgi:radical SAM protein with 4Fe4S-binding SPASM domain
VPGVELSPHHQRLREALGWQRPEGGGRFLSIYMDQNNRCNLRCRMCGFADERVRELPKLDMPRELFERIAAELFPHASYLALSLMTEPFMTRDFPDRLALVREAGVLFSDIITNGTLLTPRSIGKVLDAAISRVTFSIDGGTKEVFEAIRTGGRFELVLRNYRMLQSMRDARGLSLPRLRINHVLNELNIDSFDAFLALVESLAPEMIDVRTVLHMSPRQLIAVSHDESFFAKVRDCVLRLAAFCARTGIEDAGFLRDRAEPIDLFTDSGAKISCRRPWDTVAIHANGDVHPCMSWTRAPLGNIGSQSFEEMWRGPYAESLRREFEAMKPGIDCVHCTIRSASGEVDDDFFYRKVGKGLV